MGRNSNDHRFSMSEFPDWSACTSISTNLDAPVQQSCATLAELTTALKAAIDASPNHPIPGCTSCELTLDSSAVIPLHRPNIGPYAEGGAHDLPAEFKVRWADPEEDLQHALKGSAHKSQPIATVQEIISVADPTARSIVQRAASRGIEAAVEATDGYRYSFNNAWSAKNQDGLRFSYICQDSMQNKDRHVNGAARTQQTTVKERAAGRKPTYDCKGNISVKCSAEKGRIEVVYKHFAVHPTVAERRAMPKGYEAVAQQHEVREINGEAYGDGRGLVGALQGEQAAFDASPTTVQQAANVVRKRKRGADGPVYEKQSRSDGPSLAELLKRSTDAKPQPKQKPPTRNTNTSLHAAGVQYDLPSWEKPLPVPLPRPLQAQQTNWKHPIPYQPPYTPLQQRGSTQTYKQKYGPPRQFEGFVPAPTPIQSAPQRLPQQAMTTTFTQCTPTSTGPQQPMFMTLKPMKTVWAPQMQQREQDALEPVSSWQGARTREQSPDPWFPNR